MALAKKLPTERLQVLALAAALAYVAEDGGWLRRSSRRRSRRH